MFDLLHTIKEIMLGFFDAVGSFFSWCGELISDIVDVSVKASLAVAHTAVWIARIVPDEVGAIFGAILAVVVIYKVLGREG